MDLIIIYIIIALAIGIVITWFWTNANFNKKLQSAKDAAQIQYGCIEKEYVALRPPLIHN